MNMDNEKATHGWLANSRHLLILQRAIGFTSFGYYSTLVLITRWDRGNKYFGTIDGTQEEIAARLNISQSTFSKLIKRLQKIDRYLLIVEKRKIRLGFFPLYTAEVASMLSAENYENLHDLYEAVHAANELIQEDYEKRKSIRTQKKPQSSKYSSKYINSSLDSSIVGDDSQDTCQEDFVNIDSIVINDEKW